jgi:hypothetical protein
LQHAHQLVLWIQLAAEKTIISLRAKEQNLLACLRTAGPIGLLIPVASPPQEKEVSQFADAMLSVFSCGREVTR